MSDELKKPRNTPISLGLSGYEVDALEDYLHYKAYANRVAAGVAEEGYRGEAQNLVTIYSRIFADRLVRAVTNLVGEGALADAIEAANAASAEYLNSYAVDACEREQAFGIGQKS
ncbi:MAG: hypothetical protein I8H81_04935 [Pseudomonadales bacterium]|nr:hypothetical protein [Pseudomonadales bacterium]MBH2037052.1 hypothetical protein [Pseudomonadales bacterium]MBH2074815.1 hypothetical protein [Pseudomonadales bacterium]